MNSPLTHIPWKAGGRDLSGVDCVGLALLHLRQSAGVEITLPTPEDRVIPATVPLAIDILDRHPFRRATLTKNAIVFFKNKRGQYCHVAIYLAGDKYLHILRGLPSRIDRGLTLMQRIGLTPAAQLNPDQAPQLAAALTLPGLGDAVSITLLVVSIALSAASAFLTPRPKLGQLRNQAGQYGFDQLITATNPTLPLPDVLGAVSIAGNAPYQSRVDKSQTITDPTAQKANKVVILGAGPFEAIEYASNKIKINGLLASDPHWHASGFKEDPAQSKAEAVDGTIASESNRPSYSVYLGAPALSVPVDIRASYDRNFPIYGFAGCGYLVFRLIDSSKFSQFNLVATVKGRKCRQFDGSGFIVSTSTSEAVGTGDGATRRFKLDYDDINTVTSVTVGGTAYTEISAAQQSGQVFSVNRTKGILEFPSTVPPNLDAIVATYTYYPRTWTQNPARQIVYLLTEKIRGRGFAEDKIDWAAADALQDHCDEDVSWLNSAGQLVTEDRHHSDYAVDYRRPVQEHLRSILDSCYASLFVAGGKFVMRSRRAGTSVFSFDTSNIIRDSFSAELLDRSQRANRFHVFYHPLETFSAETEIVRDDPADQASRAAHLGNDGVVEETIRLLAVNRPSHAERLGETMLREDILTSWVVKFKTNVQALALEPGDVIDLTHPAKPSWAAKLFRVEEVQLDEQDQMEITASEYSLAPYI